MSVGPGMFRLNSLKNSKCWLTRVRGADFRAAAMRMTDLAVEAGWLAKVREDGWRTMVVLKEGNLRMTLCLRSLLL